MLSLKKSFVNSKWASSSVNFEVINSFKRSIGSIDIALDIYLGSSLTTRMETSFM